MKRRCRLKHAFARKSLAVILAAVLAIPVSGLERASVAYAAEMAEAKDDASSGDAVPDAAADYDAVKPGSEPSDIKSGDTPKPDSESLKAAPDDIPKPGNKPAEAETENEITAETAPEKTETGANVQASSADIQAWVDMLGPDGIEVNDNKITLSEDKSISGSLSVTETLVLDLNGFKLSGTAASANINMITVSGSLELSGTGSLLFTGGDNVVSVSASGTVVNRGTDIHSESCNRGVFCAGRFVLSSGCISGNISPVNGAGIVVHGNLGYLDMYGGEVSGNKASGFGGGIRIQSGASADIHGSALITGNSADTAGGGIHVLNATCHIYENAVVSENSSATGGGIYVEGTSTLDLSGSCQIINNHKEQIEQSGSATINISKTENDHVIIGITEKTLQELINETSPDGTLVLTRNFPEQESVTIKKKYNN